MGIAEPESLWPAHGLYQMQRDTAMRMFRFMRTTRPRDSDQTIVRQEMGVEHTQESMHSQTTQTSRWRFGRSDANGGIRNTIFDSFGIGGRHLWVHTR